MHSNGGSLALLLSAVSLLCACSSDASDDEVEDSAALRTASRFEVSVTWSCGDAEEDASLEANEDGDYVHTETISLGPAEECLQPAAARPATATCSWTAPARCWNVSLAIEGAAGDPVLNVSGYAGDYDTSFSSKLPVALVPRITAWETNASPDSAGGAWGSVGVKVRAPR